MIDICYAILIILNLTTLPKLLSIGKLLKDVLSLHKLELVNEVDVLNFNFIRKILDIHFLNCHFHCLSIIKYVDITFSYFQNPTKRDPLIMDYSLRCHFIIEVYCKHYKVFHILITNYDNETKVKDNFVVVELINLVEML
jgi:hypothetical protein